MVPRILMGVGFYFENFTLVYRKALTLNKHASTDLENHFHFILRTKFEGANINIITFQRMPLPYTIYNFKTNDAEVLSGIRTVCLHQFADCLLACYAAGMNTNVKLMVTLQGVRT
jgi:hypothetical protein